MGLSLSGTHAVLFIVSVILASTVSGILVGISSDISTSLTNRGDRLQDQLDTDFEIINDPDQIPNTGSDYLFYLKNIGEKRIITTNDTLQLFVDGAIVPETNYNLSLSSTYPGDVSTINVDNSEISAGDHTLRVIGSQDIEDNFTFTI